MGKKKCKNGKQQTVKLAARNADAFDDMLACFRASDLASASASADSTITAT
jgi:hypothetical protein